MVSCRMFVTAFTIPRFPQAISQVKPQSVLIFARYLLICYEHVVYGSTNMSCQSSQILSEENTVSSKFLRLNQVWEHLLVVALSDNPLSKILVSPHLLKIPYLPQPCSIWSTNMSSQPNQALSEEDTISRF